MKNITVTLDDETAAWARIYAARHNKSLSKFLGELLNATMRESAAYDYAAVAYLSRPPLPLNRDNVPYPTSDDVHER